MINLRSSRSLSTKRAAKLTLIHFSQCELLKILASGMVDTKNSLNQKPSGMFKTADSFVELREFPV